MGPSCVYIHAWPGIVPSNLMDIRPGSNPTAHWAAAPPTPAPFPQKFSLVCLHECPAEWNNKIIFKILLSIQRCAHRFKSLQYPVLHPRSHRTVVIYKQTYRRRRRNALKMIGYRHPGSLCVPLQWIRELGWVNSRAIRGGGARHWNVIFYKLCYAKWNEIQLEKLLKHLINWNWIDSAKVGPLSAFWASVDSGRD